MQEIDADKIRQMVRAWYAQTAAAGPCGCRPDPAKSCCGASPGTADSMNLVMGYSRQELSSVVDGANLGLGCGNPTAMANLKQGEVILDLGCGGGFDCFLAAQKVGDRGRVIGVDMTPEMLAKARENAAKMGATNVEFRLGEIEHLPVADNSVDIIISNCVINLSPEKKQVFQDAYRALKPGGRLAISDVVATAKMPDQLREQTALLTGCIAGAEHIDRIRELLGEPGFEKVSIEIKPHSKELIRQWFPGSGAENYVASAAIEAFKPSGSITLLPS